MYRNRTTRYVVKTPVGAIADLEVDLLIQQAEQTLAYARAVLDEDDDGHAAFEPTQHFVHAIDDAKRARSRGDLVSAWTYASLADALGRDVMKLTR